VTGAQSLSRAPRAVDTLILSSWYEEFTTNSCHSRARMTYTILSLSYYYLELDFPIR
jgi:hypothetical protein